MTQPLRQCGLSVTDHLARLEESSMQIFQHSIRGAHTRRVVPGKPTLWAVGEGRQTPCRPKR